jgi:hypothetical protein
VTFPRENDVVATLELDVLPRLRADRRRRESTAYLESLIVLRAIRLAPELATCVEILIGCRPIPVSRLDTEWTRAYGLVE